MQKVSEALAEAARQEPDVAPYYEFHRILETVIHLYDAIETVSDLQSE